MVKLVSIELTNYCTKACPFCYAKSTPTGQTFWKPEVLDSFVRDLAAHGVEAVSFGGGEPLQYEGLWDFLGRIRDVDVFKSMTTNGLLLTSGLIERLRPYLNKIHVSIHFPENTAEVERVIRQVQEIAVLGIKSGINFIVRGKKESKEIEAIQAIKDAGIGADRVIFLPMRGKGYALGPDAVKPVASTLSEKFQSTWCLLECQKSERFASVDWQGRVGWCSYTESKTQMKEFTYDGLVRALNSKELVYCG